MAKPAADVATALGGRARSIELHVRRLDRARDSGHLTVRDLDIGYAGAFLTWCTSVEGSLERLFVGLLVGRLELRANVRPLIGVRSDRVAHAVVRGERSYVDWLPFDRTSRRAVSFLAGGRPFSELANAHVKAFERSHKIRNAIAHESAHALKVFQKEFVVGRGLPPWQERPGGYLRGQHAGNQKRLEFLMSESLLAVRSLCS